MAGFGADCCGLEILLLCAQVFEGYKSSFFLLGQVSDVTLQSCFRFCSFWGRGALLFGGHLVHVVQGTML